MKASWKTTLAGILMILIALATGIKGLALGAPVDWAAVVAEVIAAVGLLAARDNDVSSEKAGAAGSG